MISAGSFSRGTLMETRGHALKGDATSWKMLQGIRKHAFKVIFLRHRFQAGHVSGNRRWLSIAVRLAFRSVIL